jgi:hypothetical protein
MVNASWSSVNKRINGSLVCGDRFILSIMGWIEEMAILVGYSKGNVFKL